MKYLKIGQAAKYLGMCRGTLRNYERDGILKPDYVTKAGYRMYLVESLDTFKKGVYGNGTDGEKK